MPRIRVLLMAIIVVWSSAMALAQEVPVGAFGIDGEPLQMRDHELNALSLGEVAPERRLPTDAGGRRLELEIAANAGPIDVSIAQRTQLSDDTTATQRTGAGAELRIGRGLVERRQGDGGDSIYVFVASDDEALTWAPGANRAGAPLELQQQVEIGDRSAGVTIERDGVQASVAYVERQSLTRVGGSTINHDQSFAGVTVTVRH
ncbi:MAG: hypothetical protein ABL883_04480 [Terricaulis sp.]